MAKSLALFTALGLVLGSPISAEMVALPDAGAKAAWAFQKTCLSTRGKGMEAAVAAILARPGSKEGQNLPAYGSGKPLRTFVDDQKLEYLIRPGKKGSYGCFVVLGANGESAIASLSESVKATLDATKELLPKPNKPKQIRFYEWSISGSKDHVRLTPKSDVGGILINLEVN